MMTKIKNTLSVFFMVLLLGVNPFYSYSQDKSAEVKRDDAKKETTAEIPQLADIIPLTAKLAEKMQALEEEMKSELDISQIESDYKSLKESLKEPEIELKQFEKDKNYSYSDLLEFKKTLVNYNKTFEGISEPLKDAITTLGNLRADWMKEKTQWDQWHDEYRKENDLNQLNANFANAKNEISKALGLILPQLDKLLKLQEAGYKNYLKINSLTVKVNALIQEHRDSALIDGSAPMFSSLYYSQFSKELWAKAKKGIAQIKWPGTSFFMSAWWVLFIQIIITFLVINLIYRKRQILLNAKHFSFLGQRPISAGLFIGTIVSFIFYQMVKYPATWEIVITMVGGISFIRLIAVLFKSSWKKQFVNVFFILLILLRIFNAINLPLPLSRLFIVLSALVGIVYLFSWLHKVKINNESKIFAWCLYLLVLYVIVILIAEILGKESLAYILFDSMLRSLVTILSYGMLMYFIYGFSDWLSRVYAQKSSAVNEKEIVLSGHKVAFMINVLIAFYILVPMLLSIWGLYDTMGLALSGMLSLGFTIGTLKISVGIVITALLILYSSYILSVIVQKLMVTSFLSKNDVDKGAQLSIGKLLHYSIMLVGFLLAISALGFELSKLTIIVSALGVGIGFGLKELVNNFVSGLILLFDRPVREGDSIEIAGVWSTVRKIGLRTTRIETSDEADVIVPNSDLVYQQVTNWTLSNRYARIIIPVGVAYGSDVPLVFKSLLDAAKANNNLVKTHAPSVLFIGFGESSLNFELRVWAVEATKRMQVISDLHQDIDSRFRKANIEIAFPQMDVHVKANDASMEIKSKEPAVPEEGNEKEKK